MYDLISVKFIIIILNVITITILGNIKITIVFTIFSMLIRLELLEYPRNDIIYIRDIGQGQFGRVFQVSESILMKLHANL